MKEQLLHKIKLNQLWNSTAGDKGERWIEDELDLTLFDLPLAGQCLSDSYLIACIFNGMRLCDVHFDSSWLFSAQFKGCDLTGSSFIKADLLHADFSNAVLQKATLLNADCMYTNFRNADFTQADLRGAFFCEADLQGGKLIAANIAASVFDEVLLHGADLTGMIGIEDDATLINSINIGTEEEPIWLKQEEAKQWMLIQALNH